MVVVEFMSNEQTEPLGKWLLDAVPRAEDTLALVVRDGGGAVVRQRSYKVINVQWVVDALGTSVSGEIKAVVYMEGENA